MPLKGIPKLWLLWMYTKDTFRRAVGIGQATKPLPRLPRGWSRVCHETGTFLRSIGLGIVVSVFQGFFRTGFREPEKAAIRQSRLAALLRSLIHAVPLGMAIFEIVLNWKGRYHGASFDGQSFLQFVAKAHEIFMQASIATIILSYTRHHMSISTGMPFGAILGSLQFLQVSYLWSVEFLSAIMSKDFQLRKKMCFIGLILLCVTIAATAGPSSATLLLARQGPWPRKSTYLAVNATSQELWPNRLEGDRISSGCKILSTEDRPHCPTIRQTPDFVTNKCQRVIEMSSDGTLDDPEASSVFLIRSLASHAVDTITFNHCGTSSPDQVCSTSPQSWIADQFVNGTLKSFDTPEATNALDFYRLITRNYYQPYTVTSCVADTVQNDSDQAPLRFARISLTVDEVKKAREIVPVPSLTKSQLVNSIPGNVSQVRVGWIDLPQGIFATGTPGAVIVYPQSPSNSSYNIATCTFGAGWGSSELAMGSSNFYAVISTMTNYPSSLEHVDPGDTVSRIPWTTPIFVNDSRFSYPQLPVSISKSWMEFVNPSIILPDNSTIDIVALSLSSRPSLPSESETAALFSYLLTTALGDTGMGFTSKGTSIEQFQKHGVL